MDVVSQLKRGISRQFSTGSIKKSGRFSFRRQSSFDPRLSNANRFIFGRQSSLDPNRRSPINEELTVPENLDSTMQMLFLACRGDVGGVEELLKDGVDVNSIDLDGRTALHIAACEGQVQVVRLLLDWKANVDARDRWGSTPAADAKYYDNIEVYNILKACGAKISRMRKTPMAVSNPRDVPEYEVNPIELQFRRGEDVFKILGIKVMVSINFQRITQVIETARRMSKLFQICRKQENFSCVCVYMYIYTYQAELEEADTNLLLKKIDSGENKLVNIWLTSMTNGTSFNQDSSGNKIWKTESMQTADLVLTNLGCTCIRTGICITCNSVLLLFELNFI